MVVLGLVGLYNFGAFDLVMWWLLYGGYSRKIYKVSVGCCCMGMLRWIFQGYNLEERFTNVLARPVELPTGRAMVKYSFGKIKKETDSGGGWNWVLGLGGLYESAVIMDTRTRTIDWKVDRNLNTKDGVELPFVDYSTSYRISSPKKVLEKIGVYNQEEIVNRRENMITELIKNYQGTAEEKVAYETRLRKNPGRIKVPAKYEDFVRESTESLIRKIAGSCSFEEFNSISGKTICGINEGANKYPNINDEYDFTEHGLHVMNMLITQVDMPDSMRESLSAAARADAKAKEIRTLADAEYYHAEQRAAAAAFYKDNPEALELRRIEAMEALSKGEGNSKWVIPSDILGGLTGRSENSLEDLVKLVKKNM
jgi:regulator of protease activity HflC (stomatin/prohibitin superfamily)